MARRLNPALDQPARTRDRFAGPPDVEAMVSIDAPIELVWSVMVDLGAYGQWNPFVVRVDGPSGRAPDPGDLLVLHVRWANDRETKAREVVTRAEPPAADEEVAWAELVYEFRGWPYRAGLARGRRTQHLEQRASQPTLYRTTEHFGGLLKRFLPVRRTQEGFERHAAALRARAERLRHGG